MSEEMIVALLGAVSVIGASSGFWTYFTGRARKKDTQFVLLKALTYDKILTLGLAYIDRGWITKDEFEELRNNFFDPYKAMGGNGVAERVMNDVGALPFRTIRLTEIIIKEKQREIDQ
jgi:hypothetical protein